MTVEDYILDEYGLDFKGLVGELLLNDDSDYLTDAAYFLEEIKDRPINHLSVNQRNWLDKICDDYLDACMGCSYEDIY